MRLNNKTYYLIIVVGFFGLLVTSILQNKKNTPQVQKKVKRQRVIPRKKINIDLKDFENCRKKRIKDLGLIKGEVLLSIEVEENGKVASADIKNTSINDKLFKNCIISSAHRLKFSKDQIDEKYILIPLKFD